MENYELSKAADKDFEDIFEYGIGTFGLDHASAYQARMKKTVCGISETIETLSGR